MSRIASKPKEDKVLDSSVWSTAEEIDRAGCDGDDRYE